MTQGKFSMKFTIVELLIVIAIITILASMLLPALNKARDFAKGASCINNLRQTSISASNYSCDFTGGFPVIDENLASWGKILMIYQQGTFITTNMKEFLCPSWAPYNNLKDAIQYNSYGVCIQGYNDSKWFRPGQSGGLPFFVAPLKSTSPSKQIFFGDSVFKTKAFPSSQCYYIWYPSINYEGLPMVRHNNRRSNFAFADGHVSSQGLSELGGWLREAKASGNWTLVWDANGKVYQLN